MSKQEARLKKAMEGPRKNSAPASKQVEVPEGLIGAAGAESMRQHHFRPNDEIDDLEQDESLIDWQLRAVEAALRAASIPTTTDVEGYLDDADEALAEGAAGEIQQPEGGDEEDWPELWIQRGDPLNPETWAIWGSAENPEVVPHEIDGAHRHRYLPATSQDSSGLREWKDALVKSEKALQQSNEIATELKARAERAETALEETAQGFDATAASLDPGRTAVPSYETARQRGRAEAYRTAARELRQDLAAREKAAKLKEGTNDQAA